MCIILIFCGEFYTLDYFDRHLIHTISIYRCLQYQGKINKTPAKAFTPPADEKKMGTIWIVDICVLRRLRLRQGQMQGFLGLKVGRGGLNLQIWDLNRPHETERTVFPILQRFSACVDANYDIKESIKDIQQTVQ